MGTFNVEIGIGDPNRVQWRTLNALVDTGASISAAPASVLRGLGVEPSFRQSFRSAHGESREMDVGHTWVRVDGKEVFTLVLFNDEGSTPLLGAVTLESVFMMVDPVDQKLVPREGLI